jgi:hypothetical protein
MANPAERDGLLKSVVFDADTVSGLLGGRVFLFAITPGSPIEVGKSLGVAHCQAALDFLDRGELDDAKNSICKAYNEVEKAARFFASAKKDNTIDEHCYPAYQQRLVNVFYESLPILGELMHLITDIKTYSAE